MTTSDVLSLTCVDRPGVLAGFNVAKPYHKAPARGVRSSGRPPISSPPISTTGRIVEQGVAPVTHAHTATRLVALGQDTDGLALSRAVRAWAEGRIHLIGIKTIVCT